MNQPRHLPGRRRQSGVALIVVLILLGRATPYRPIRKRKAGAPTGAAPLSTGAAPLNKTK